MDISKITPIEDFDTELAERLLIRWHSSTRSHPAMKEERDAIAKVFNIHVSTGHNCDFETCLSLICRMAVMLEQAYGWIEDDLMRYNEERQ